MMFSNDDEERAPKSQPFSSITEKSKRMMKAIHPACTHSALCLPVILIGFSQTQACRMISSNFRVSMEILKIASEIDGEANKDAIAGTLFSPRSHI
jgi:hypothetical protein